MLLDPPRPGARGAIVPRVQKNTASAENEQKAFNRLVDKEPELLAGPVALLPYTHFPTGHGNPPLRPSVAMVHANWVRGHDAKVKRLRFHKLWRDGACADFQ